jgi:aminopeptidase N
VAGDDPEEKRCDATATLLRQDLHTQLRGRVNVDCHLSRRRAEAAFAYSIAIAPGKWLKQRFGVEVDGPKYFGGSIAHI